MIVNKLKKIYSILAFTFFTYVNQLLNVVINLLMINALTLTQLGDVALAKIWMRAMEYSHLGSRFSIDRYAPVWNEKYQKRLVKSSIVISTFVYFLLTVLQYLLLESSEIVYSFLSWGYLLAIATIYKNYFRAISKDDLMLRVYLLSPCLLSLIQVIILYTLDFHKFLIFNYIITIFISFFFLFVLISEKVLVKSYIKVFLLTRGNSYYFFLNSIVTFFAMMVDRLFIEKTLGKEVLGEYSIILFSFALMQMIPTSISQFYFPKVVSMLQKNKSKSILKNLSGEFILIFTVTTIFLSISYFMIPYGIKVVNHEYIYLTDYIRIIIISIIPYCFIPILTQAFSALDLRRTILFLSLACMLVFVILLLLSLFFFRSDLYYAIVYIKALYPFLVLLTYSIFLFFRGKI